jgi:hypothetical protein
LISRLTHTFTLVFTAIKAACIHGAPITVARSGISVHLSLGAAPAAPKTESSTAKSDSVRDHLQSETIDLPALRSLTFGGCPNETMLRSLLWRVLLGYLPAQRGLWPQHLHHKRNQYAMFCSEFIVDPDTLADNDDDDPLGASAGEDCSKYSEYFKNKELMLEIDKDTKRTWSSMHFFAVPGPQQDQASHISGPSKQQVCAPLLILPTSGFIYHAQGSHQQCIARALFVFARLNPGIRYVQGMNELLAPM